jgi:hypothetical protein
MELPRCNQVAVRLGTHQDLAFPEGNQWHSRQETHSAILGTFALIATMMVLNDMSAAPIAGHGHQYASGLNLFDFGSLVLGQDFGEEFIQSGLVRNQAGRRRDRIRMPFEGWVGLGG